MPEMYVCVMFKMHVNAENAASLKATLEALDNLIEGHESVADSYHHIEHVEGWDKSSEQEYAEILELYF